MVVTLILEDGTMPVGANTYVSLEDADTYLCIRGEWEETPVITNDNGESVPDESVILKKQRALIRAFDFLNTLKWKGDTVQYGRTIAFPRKNVVVYDPDTDKEITLDSDFVPSQVSQAQMELAVLIYKGLNPFEAQERKGIIQSYSESKSEGSIDAIGGDSSSHSVTYVNGASTETYLPSVYGYIRNLLAVVPGEMSGISQSLVEVG